MSVEEKKAVAKANRGKRVKKPKRKTVGPPIERVADDVWARCVAWCGVKGSSGGSRLRGQQAQGAVGEAGCGPSHCAS